MHPAEQVIQQRLEAGQKPTYDEIEAALAAVLAERNAGARMLTEMANTAYGLAGWLGQISAAHASKQAGAVSSLLDAFNAESLKLRDQYIKNMAGLPG